MTISFRAIFHIDTNIMCYPSGNSDRITNTINVVGSNEPVCRPTVINMYDGDLSNLKLWWSAWERFMFDTPLTIQKKEGAITDPPYKMLQPIKKVRDDESTLYVYTSTFLIFTTDIYHCRSRNTLILLQRRRKFHCHCKQCVGRSLMPFWFT